MYEAYAASLVGVVCGGVAVAALTLSRRLSPLSYALIHVAAVLVMVVLVTVGYQKVPFSARHPQPLLSNVIYIGVSWILFVNTLLFYWYLHRPKVSKARWSSDEPIG